MSNLPKNVTSQHFEAVKTVIGARLPGVTSTHETVGKVSNIVHEAIDRSDLLGVRLILRFADRWVDAETKEYAQAHLLETTQVDDMLDLNQLSEAELRLLRVD